MDILKELDDELIDISILGIANLQNNYRFEMLKSRFNELREFSSVLEKISDYINQMYEGTDSEKVDVYLKLKNFVRALLVYISDFNIDLDGASDYKTYNMPYKFNLSYEMIQHVEELFNSNVATGKWTKLNEIYKSNGFSDNRLIEIALKNLDNSYTYIEDYGDENRPKIEISIADIIAVFGEEIIVILKEKYYLEFKNENRQAVKNNIIKSILKISDKELYKFLDEIFEN